MAGTIDTRGRFTREGASRTEPPAPHGPAEPAAAVVTLTRPVKIASALFGLLMLALLAAQLAMITQQRAINAEQRNIARIQRDRARPVMQDSRVLLNQARDGIAALQAGAGRADQLVRGLNRTDAPRAIAAAGELATALVQQDRLNRMIDGFNAMLTDLARHATVKDVDRLQRIADDLLNLQARAYRTTRSSLATQRRTEA